MKQEKYTLKKRIKAVLFDLDGTVVDSSEGITKSVQYALSKYNIDAPDLEDLKKFIGPPLSESFMRYYGIPEDETAQAISYYRERYSVKGLYECCLYPGIEKAIEDLKEDGYFIGMASGKPEGFCHEILKYHGVDKFFDEVVGTTINGPINTKEQVLSEFLRRHPELNAAECILVGDTKYDADGAKLVGMPCLGVSFGFGDRREMLDRGVISVVDTADEIKSMIDSQN